MKRPFHHISPYLLLLVPIFVALTILLVFADPTVIEDESQIRASFIRIPDFNIFNALCKLLW